MVQTDQEGLKMYGKRQKIEFFGPKIPVFSGTRGTPLPPLTENRAAKRPLKEFPPPRPLDEKNSLSSILRVLNRNRWFCTFGLVDSV